MKGRQRLDALVALAGLVGPGAQLLERPQSVLDEYLPLVAAQRIAAGEVPYRDFFSLYPPLVPGAYAGLFAVTGPSLVAARLLFLALAIAALVLVRRLAARISGSERTGTLVALAAAATMGAPPWGYAVVPAGVLVLGAALALLASQDADAREGRWLVLAGGLVGLAALARVEIAAVAGGLLVGLVVVTHPRGPERRRALAAFVGPAAVPGILLALGLVAAGAGGEAFRDLVALPATIYPRARALPLPLPWNDDRLVRGWPSAFGVYAPFALAALAGIAAARRGSALGGERRLAIGLACGLPVVLGVSAWVRPDRFHVAAASLAAPLALALLARLRAWPELGLALALLAPVAARETAVSLRDARDACGRKGGALAWLDRGGWESPARRAALAAVAARPPGTRIFVGLPRHDRIVTDDVAFYWDAGALPATRLHELHPLVATTLEGQETIVRDLEAARAPFVVLSAVPQPDEPNESARSSGTAVLDSYVAARYAPVLRAGPYTVLERR